MKKYFNHFNSVKYFGVLIFFYSIWSIGCKSDLEKKSLWSQDPTEKIIGQEKAEKPTLKRKNSTEKKTNGY